MDAGTDNDCDGDAGEVDAEASDRVTWYGDADGDGYGDSSVTQLACEQPDGYVAAAGDCDDAEPAVNPGASEACNGIDDDCAGGIDDGLEFRDYYADADGDGYGDDAYVQSACASPGQGWVETGGDACPADGALTAPVAYFIDGDADGYGTDATALHCSAEAPAGHAAVAGDCDDAEPAVNPGASEACNGIDDDCAGGIDDGLEFRDYYADADGDGYGDDTYVQSACAPPGGGWVETGGDACVEDPAKIEPGACGCGAADTDGDADGSADCVDNCIDLYNPGQGDCDADGYGDACAIASGAPDCNANAIPDACDIASGVATDIDGNSQPDACQPDCNANALPDAWEVAQGIAEDCNANGLPDDCEDGSVRRDTGDLGGIAAGTALSALLPGNTFATTTVAVRIDVIADFSAADAYIALELNGLAVAGDIAPEAPSSCATKPIVVELELSIVEWAQVIDAATAPGGVAVRLVGSESMGAVPCSAGSLRVGISYGGTGYDCDGDGDSDLCQLASGEGDCDGNGALDACETGGAGDTDADGVPDSCERARGDFNLDGVIDGTDLSFVLGAWGVTGDHAADLNRDGEVAGEDLAVLLAAWGTLSY